jgi:hypothetical protein
MSSLFLLRCGLSTSLDMPQDSIADLAGDALIDHAGAVPAIHRANPVGRVGEIRSEKCSQELPVKLE